MLSLLSALRHKCAVGYVGGSDLAKQQEQLGTSSINVTSLFDFCFAENGLTAFRLAEPLESNSFIKWLGEDKYKQLVNWCLVYIAGLDIPVKRGTFVEFRCVYWPAREEAPAAQQKGKEGASLRGTSSADNAFWCFRNGMVNVSPIGRNASTQERNDYQAFDNQHQIRAKMVEALKAKFPDYGLTYVSWIKHLPFALVFFFFLFSLFFPSLADNVERM